MLLHVQPELAFGQIDSGCLHLTISRFASKMLETKTRQITDSALDIQEVKI